MTDRVDLEPDLQAWVERVAKAAVTSAQRHFAGASREAWSVDVDVGDGARALFLLRDKGEGKSGSVRDAAVLRALATSDVPVPAVVGLDEASGAILLERLPGRSDFPNVDEEVEREPTARHLMELTAKLHAIPPRSLDIPHLELPGSALDCARGSLDQIDHALEILGDAADPFFRHARAWLEARVPDSIDRFALVHSDMGPGNFLFEGGRVTGIVDWEVAHFGDPMEDLAAIGVRDVATPVGSLSDRLAEYAECAGTRPDLARIDYYRVLVLTRNSLMIGLGLAHPPPNFEFVEMTMYQTSLMRAAAMVICDRLGIERPLLDAPEPSRATSAPELSDLLAALSRDLSQTILPALEDDLAIHRGEAMGRGLETLAHEGLVGRALDREELSDLNRLLDTSVADLASAERALRDRLAEDAKAGGDSMERFAGYFARRMQRRAERRRPLMGALFERLPQRLEAT